MIKNVFIEGSGLSGFDIHQKLDMIIGTDVKNRKYHLVKVKFNDKGAFVIYSE